MAVLCCYPNRGCSDETQARLARNVISTSSVFFSVSLLAVSTAEEHVASNGRFQDDWLKEQQTLGSLPSFGMTDNP
jgi:hypothetical protein